MGPRTRTIRKDDAMIREEKVGLYFIAAWWKEMRAFMDDYMFRCHKCEDESTQPNSEDVFSPWRARSKKTSVVYASTPATKVESVTYEMHGYVISTHVSSAAISRSLSTPCPNHAGLQQQQNTRQDRVQQIS